jgi:hypothetical protein
MPICGEIAERCAINAKDGLFFSIVWFNQIDHTNQMNYPHLRLSRVSQEGPIEAQSFITIHMTSTMRRTSITTVPTMMQVT